MDLFNKEPSDKFIAGFAANNKMTDTGVRGLINDSPDWKKTLDEEAFSRAKKGISTPKGDTTSFLKDLNTNNMRNMTGKEILGYNELATSEQAKNAGSNLRGFSEKTGYGSSIEQARGASFKTRLAAFGSTLSPIGGSNKNSVQEAFGFVSKENKIMAAKGSMFEKITRKGLIPGLTAVTAFSLIGEDEDPLSSFLTMSAGTWGLQQGWRQGKAGADLLGKPSHWKRIPLGGVTSLGLGAIAAGASWGINDLGKNDSVIAKKVKKIYGKETYASTKATQESLTMRRAALNKLSSSSLNNRGQLLGNEATILRSAQY